MEFFEFGVLVLTVLGEPVFETLDFVPEGFRLPCIQVFVFTQPLEVVALRGLELLLEVVDVIV